MKNVWQKISQYARSRKKLSAAILLVIVAVGYYGYKKLTDTSGETRYVVAAVDKGTIVSIVSGTGQVSASNQITLNAKASGDVTYVGASAGQNLAAGAVIVQLDSHNAELDLENAQLALAKLKKPADASTVTQAENALADAKDAAEKAKSDLPKNYDDGFNTVAVTFSDLAGVMDGLDNLFHSYQSGGGFLNDFNLSKYGDATKQLRDKAEGSYFVANNKYQLALADYNRTKRTSATSSVNSLISETYEATRAITAVLQDAGSAANDINSQLNQSERTNASAAISNINSWSSQVNTHLSDLQSIKSTIDSAEKTITSSQRDITAKAQALDKIKEGADPLDLRSQELVIEQKQSALADYTVRAPFGGVLAKLNVNVGDSVSGSTDIGTFITKQKIADISLNEVDVAKIKIGDKVTLTFDAVDNLSITGQVLEIDQVGTVTQGVVTYNAKIGFDTDDTRVKPGMSVSADITTAVEQDVLVVPNGAVKSNSNGSYVQLVDKNITVTGSQGAAITPTITQQPVQVGLSDDSSTEITSGLQVGDKLIIKTIAPSATKTTTAAPSLIGGGGGGVRVPGGGGRGN